MRGSIRRRSRGSWELTIDLGRDPVSGKRQRKFVHIKGTKKAAEAELDGLIHAARTGTYVDASKETVAAYLERWLRDYVTPTVAPRTYDRYAQIVRQHIVPALGTIPLAQLRPAHIVAAERTWQQGGRRRGRGGLSARTVLHHHRVLHEALRQAVRWQMLAVNPADAVTPPRVVRTEMRALTADQARGLLAAARESEHEAAIVTALYSGLRLGELLGLRWRDIDLAAGQLRVQQAVQPVRGGGVTFGPTKTHRSRRPVSIPAAAVATLREHRTRQLEQRLAAGAAWAGNDLVFADPLGAPVSPWRLRQAFYGLLRQAELPTIRLHDLRHTMATLMMAAGEHPKVVSERLGHSTVTLTLDTYSHVLPGLQEAAAERLAATLRPMSADLPGSAP